MALPLQQEQQQQEQEQDTQEQQQQQQPTNPVSILTHRSIMEEYNTSKKFVDLLVRVNCIETEIPCEGESQIYISAIQHDFLPKHI